MKKICIFLFCVLAATACDSFFDINLKDQATLEDTMSRSATVKRYLAHLYSYIPREEAIRNYEGGTVLRADESLVAKSQYETYWYKVRRGEYGSDNSNSDANANYWSRYYIAINECTTFIDNLKYDFLKTMIMITIEGWDNDEVGIADNPGALMCLNTLIRDGVVVRQEITEEEE